MKKKILRMWCFLMIVLILGGCGMAEKQFLPTLDGAFRYELSGRCGGVEMCAFAEAGEIVTEQDGTRVRSVRMVFTAPESLAGMVLSCERFLTATGELGEVTVTLDGMIIENTALAGLLTPALLLAADFEVTKTATETRDGRTICLVSATANGNTRTVGVDPSTSEPVSLTGTFCGIVFDGVCVHGEAPAGAGGRFLKKAPQKLFSPRPYDANANIASLRLVQYVRANFGSGVAKKVFCGAFFQKSDLPAPAGASSVHEAKNTTPEGVVLM